MVFSSTEQVRIVKKPVHKSKNDKRMEKWTDEPPIWTSLQLPVVGDG